MRQLVFAFALAGSYLGLIGILTWQALRGQSIIDPDALTLVAMVLWLGAAIGTIAFALNAAANSRTQSAAAV